MPDRSHVRRTTSSTPVRYPIRYSALLLLVLSLPFAPAGVFSQTTTDGTSTIFEGNARFQFLTPSLVRMEYSNSGKFIDAPTAVIKRRNWPAVEVHSKSSNGWLTATTTELKLRYRLNSGPFTAEDLEVTWKDSPASSMQVLPLANSHVWHPGDADSLNLGGLTYSLDGVSESNLPKTQKALVSPAHDTIPGINIILPVAQPGLLSMSGYAFINDSRTPVWNSRDRWIESRPDTTSQDWYLFVYRRDYAKVLNEYAELSGRIPMIPRYTLGPWITDLNFEYFPNSQESEQLIFKHYNEQHLKDEVLKFRENDIPLDVLVLDFGWHNYGWGGGYDWSPLIPNPKQFLNWLGHRGVKVTLNDHPGYAGTKMNILSYNDSHTPQVLKDLGKAMPPKPTFDMDISGGWKFSIDPQDSGVIERWYAEDYVDTNWKPINVGVTWEDQGHENYRGIGWYRRTVTLPLKIPDSLYLYLGEVVGPYRLYVNGHEVSHNTVQWPQRLTYSQIGSLVKAGQENKIAIRVVGDEGGGGITARPVALENVAPPSRIYFDLSNKKQAGVFMNDLHKPLMKEGVKFWWVDGGSGDVDLPGINEQLWTNRVYYDYTQRETGERGFIFSRYGGWGSQRYPAFFTGDTYSQWPVLAYEVAFTSTGGNVLVPYITNDIGGFHGAKIDFDLYARWIEFGTFSPILRLHSAHENPYEGDVRMPWTYGEKGMSLARKYFVLRIGLIPYIYTYTKLAHDESMPILRPLYLEYPGLEEAYEHPHEYFFGSEILVAPVVDSTGDRAVYLPPGDWIDFFTGKKFDGGETFRAHYSVDETPVFVREGSIIPEQEDMAYSDAGPMDTVLVNIYGNGKGDFDLYEDDGTSLKYETGQYSWTSMSYSTKGDGSHQVFIGPTKGSFKGQPQRRSYQISIHSIEKPNSVTLNGHEFRRWTWNSDESTLLIRLPEGSIRDKIAVEVKS